MKKSLLLVIISILMLCLCSCSKDDSDSSTRESRRRQKDTETVEDDTDDDDDYDVDYDDFDDDDYIDYDDDDIDYDDDEIDYDDYDFEDDDYDFEDDDYDSDYDYDNQDDDDDIDYDDDSDYDDYDSDDAFDYQDDDDYDDSDYTDYDDTDPDDTDQDDFNPGGNTDDEPKNTMTDPVNPDTGMRVLTDYNGNPATEFKLPAGYTFTSDYAKPYDLMFCNYENEDLYLEISFSDCMYYGDVLKTGRQFKFGEMVVYTDSETLGTELEGSNDNEDDDDVEYSHTIILLGYDQNHNNRAVYSVVEYGDVPRTYRLLYVQLGANSWMCIRSQNFQQDGILNVDAINAQIDFYNSLF